MPHKDPEAARAYRKKRYAANRETILASNKAYREANHEAVRATERAYYEANREARKDSMKAYYVVNRVATAARNKSYREANRETVLARQKAYYVANRETVLARDKAYRQTPKGKAVGRTAANHRRALKLKACPPWADREHIALIYAGCPEGMHVDHLFPLKGKGCTGLHIPSNLYYLPASANQSKGNRLPPPALVEWLEALDTRLLGFQIPT